MKLDKQNVSRTLKRLTARRPFISSIQFPLPSEFHLMWILFIIPHIIIFYLLEFDAIKFVEQIKVSHLMHTHTKAIARHQRHMSYNLFFAPKSGFDIELCVHANRNYNLLRRLFPRVSFGFYLYSRYRIGKPKRNEIDGFRMPTQCWEMFEKYSRNCSLVSTTTGENERILIV